MHWRDLLSRIGVCEPPVPDLVRASADRSGLVNRRAFLGLAGAAVAGLAIDPEALLWSPGQTTIFLPTPHRNTLITPYWMTREMLRLMEQRLALLGSVYRTYDDEDRRVGDTIRVPVPRRFTGPHDGGPWGQWKPAVLDRQLAVDMATPMDGLSPAQVSARYLEPAAAQLAREFHHQGLNICGRLPLPTGVHTAQSVTSRNGLSLRGIQQYDIERDAMLLRFDVLGGRAS